MGEPPVSLDSCGLAACVAQSSGMGWQPVRRTGTGWRPAPPWRGEAWCYVWAIFTSACFGVVLEGPMGAVVFWILLGAAAARGRRRTTAGAPPADADFSSLEKGRETPH